MKPRDTATRVLFATALVMWLAPAPALALKSDRQQPLEVKADATDGNLGDGLATLSGHVEIRQGTLLITAEVATVEKVDGRARRFQLTGNPVHLQQEIENEGVVTAEARQVDYEVASGIVTLSGNADVDHPQYQISGEVLRYDMNVQHFQGSGGDDNGRIRIQLNPEVISSDAAPGSAPEVDSATGPANPPTNETEDGADGPSGDGTS